MPPSSKISRRYINSLETKNKIFTTALMLFTKHGYENVKIDDIARYAGISRATFYAYFKTKDAVIVEQFRKIDEHYTMVFKSLPPGKSAFDKLLLLGKAVGEYCADICGITVMKVAYISQIGLGKNAIILSKDRVFFSIIREIVQQAKAEGIIPPDMEEEELAEMVARFLRAPVFDWCLHDGAFNLHQAIVCQLNMIKKFMRIDDRPNQAMVGLHLAKGSRK